MSRCTRFFRAGVFWALILLATAALYVAPLGAACYPPQGARGHGVVRSSHPVADAVGQGVLAKGGNAVDAAVAVGYALAVVHPEAGSLGGGGFAVIRLADGTVTTLDFREKAPSEASHDMFLDEEGNVIPDASTLGYRAAAVPGMVAGMSAMLEKYGTLALDELIDPARDLANTGVRINARQERLMAENAPRLSKFASSKKYFLKADGSTYKEGDILLQKDLAKSLKLIAENGQDVFYEGEIANLILYDMRSNGSPIRRADLANYEPTWREPVKGTYRGYEVFSMGPPSSGGTHIIQLLNILEQADIRALGFGSSQSIHLLAEAMRHAFADRSEYLGDPDFSDVPVAELTDKSYAAQIYKKIKDAGNKAIPSAEVAPGLAVKESDNTTHYSVLDKEGNAVAVTYTINGAFGSAAAVMGAGFLLNSEMDDFTAKAGAPNAHGLTGSHANAIAPGKLPLSSMAPTIVVKNDRPVLVLGSSGGPRIISATLQVICNVLDHGMDVSEAVAAPRVHMQWLPDELRVERFSLVKDVEDILTRMGYAISEKRPMGEVNAVYMDVEEGRIFGTDDPRGKH